MGTKTKKSRKDDFASKEQQDEISETDDSSSVTHGENDDLQKISRKRKKHCDITQSTETPTLDEANLEPPREQRTEEGQTAQTKSYRKRKKHYYNGIRNQMEFYFGDANLSKDRFLKQLIDKDPYISLDVFLTFNKMKAITTRVEDIAKSLTNSQLLELDETQTKVKRKTPLVENRNVDEKTIYVEALPPTADHEWVRQIFERFGKVEYISLPKYAKSHKIKEFGFVEFEKEESVGKAIESFKEFNGVLCMQEKDPSELISVKSFIKEQAAEEGDISEPKIDSKKRSNQDMENQPDSKKVKTESHDAEETTSNVEEATPQTDNESSVSKENDGEETEKKKRRKRKKKSKSEEKLKRKAELNTDVSYYELKILPKKDWKRLRNKYLNLQREKVAELKRKAWKEQQEHKRQNSDITKDEGGSQLPQKDKKKKSKESKHKLQKMNMNFYGAAAEEHQPKTPTAEKGQHNPALERPPLFTYEEGLIVEMSFLEPCINVKEYKADMRQYTSVKYVDVKEGSMQAFLRLDSAEKANEFLQNVSCAEYQCKILSGEAEKAYWRKIEKDREQKLNKQVKVPQKRGREKVKKLISKHIRFGDDDDKE
ncbi:la related protein 7 [Haematobia irritans]|uniref:la related protein 7 n=1 Tax=Haematobia irritans TaxID=7368 RepID=UPI003F50C6E7